MVDVTSITRKVSDTMSRLSEVDMFLTSVSNSVKQKDSILSRLCGLEYEYTNEEKDDEANN